MPGRSYCTRAASYVSLACVLSSFARVDCVLVNRTIDDDEGDNVTGAQPVYFPDNGWALGSICTTCNIHSGLVDLSKTFDRTWHDTTHHPDAPEQVITATFSGVAVYVFNLIANTVNSTTTLTNLSFTLDGELAGYYLHAPDPARTDILYNVSVFSNTSLANGPHTLEIRPTGPFSSLILFDYITYTVDEETTTSTGQTPRSSSSTSTVDPTAGGATPTSAPPQAASRASSPSRGAIVGGTVAGAVIVAITAAALFFVFRRHRQQQHRSSPAGSTGLAADNDAPRDAPMAERRGGPGLAGLPPAYTSDPNPPAEPLESPSPSNTPPRPTSAIAATVQSRRYTELTNRIHIIESRIGQSLPAPSPSTTPTSSASRSAGTRSQEGRRLARELAALRREVTELRGLLQQERELSSEMMMMYRT